MKSIFVALLAITGVITFMVTFPKRETEFDLARVIAISILAGMLLFSAGDGYAQVAPLVDDAQREQMNQLIDRVRNRVNEAAQAATYILEAEQHRHQSDRMAEAGRHDEARTELRLATKIVDAPGLSVQGDLLFHDYVSKLRQAMTALDRRQDLEEHDETPGLVRIHSAPTFIEDILKANALPPKLAAVVMVESAGDPKALSAKGARGLWQLMPDTARRYGLRVDDQIDERVDLVKSTFAAVRYLSDLYETFRDWPLALAAYNYGENRIQKLMDRTGIRRFSEMAAKRLLPAETAQYVPAVLSLMASRR